MSRQDNVVGLPAVKQKKGVQTGMSGENSNGEQQFSVHGEENEFNAKATAWQLIWLPEWLARWFVG